MLYLVEGENKIPQIDVKTYEKLVIINQITKKEYEYPVTDYTVLIDVLPPNGQYDVFYGDIHYLAQVGEFKKEKTTYSNNCDIRAYNG